MSGASFPYTPATNLLYGLSEGLAMLAEEGLPAVFARHQRHAAATRAAVRAWGLEVRCADEREHSGSLTAVLLPAGHDADAPRHSGASARWYVRSISAAPPNRSLN
jgi:alanine-glyoxylate transaminase/serine-glyoxylate transaminase/serine-pyruvate transaminase